MRQASMVMLRVSARAIPVSASSNAVGFMMCGTFDTEYCFNIKLQPYGLLYLTRLRHYQSQFLADTPTTCLGHMCLWTSRVEL